MIPIRDSVRSQTFPVVNVAIIIVNVLVFLFELSLNQRQLGGLVYTFGIVPKNISAAIYSGHITLFTIIPFIGTMFLHGGWVHLLGNMLFLWVFGDNIEDRLGHARYLVFYLLVGIGASIVQIVINPDASQPLIGASGAIAGILGAYILTFPRAKVVTLVPIFFFFTFIEIPAVIFLVLWFGIQAFNGLASIGAPMANTVAWWAHIGGFLSGMVLIKVFPKRVRYYNWR